MKLMDMEAEKIRQLIEKYYQGETTIKEESRLKAALMNHQGNEFKAEKDQFLFFEMEKEVTAPDVKRMESEASYERHRNGTSFHKFYWIAAAILLLVPAIWWLVNQKQPGVELERFMSQSVSQHALILPDQTKVWLNKNFSF